ncbi:Uncharacterized protein At2g33490 [Linum perenne]
MRTSLRKLRGLALNKHSQSNNRNNGGDGARDGGRNLRSMAQLDELARATQDVQDMRECYDSLLSSAAATANSAYELSESWREMGACLLEKTALNDDEESGKVLLMLGKVQFELQNLVDVYRSHVFKTITIPSDSLLNELQTVEEMKEQCNEKREMYEYMRTRQREKGRGRNMKGEESFSADQVQAACDEYDEEATLFVFRLKSLKEGQSRSLLTQAARHHAAQISFFKKALKALEDVEPHVKSVTESRFINYRFDGLDDDDGEDDDDSNTNDTNDDGELSFQHDQNDYAGDASTSSDSMEVDGEEISFPKVSTSSGTKENPHRSYRSFSFRGDARTASQSAPLYSVRKSASVDRMEQLRPSFAKKFNSYVLPTPGDSKNTSSTPFSGPITPTIKPFSGPIAPTFKGNGSGSQSNFHEPKNHERQTSQSVLRESNNRSPTRLTLPKTDGLLIPRLDRVGGFSDYNKKIKRQAFSGPIARKSWSSGPHSLEKAQRLSGPLLQQQQTRIPQTQSSPPSNSPTLLSSPRISELHELPRPPPARNIRPWSFGAAGHSAPLFPKAQLRSSATVTATPLPVPSQVSRSLSMSSTGHRSLNGESPPPQTTESPDKVVEEFFSPPLTPISALNSQPTAADFAQTGNRVKSDKS